MGNCKLRICKGSQGVVSSLVLGKQAAQDAINETG